MGKADTNGNQTARGTFATGNRVGNRFQKGRSGNPAGRPPGAKNISTVLRDMMQQLAPDEIANAAFVKKLYQGRKKVTLADALAARLYTMAIVGGNLKAIREILDRVVGRPQQKVDIDMQVADWRELAESAGLDEQDVVREAKQLLKSFNVASR